MKSLLHLPILLFSITLPTLAPAQIAFTRLARANDIAVTTVPGTSTAFQSFNHVATDGTNVVFWGSNTSQDEGIYAWNGTRLRKPEACQPLAGG